MIGGNTIIEEQLQKAILLDDSIAWIDAHNNDLKKTILGYIKQDQLIEEGVDSNDQIIGTYSFYTELLSNGRKKQGEPYDLKDTGAFFKSMFVKVLKNSILIDADFEKMEDQNWWSIDILGLTETNLDKYAELVRKNYIIYARRILGIN